MQPWIRLSKKREIERRKERKNPQEKNIQVKAPMKGEEKPLRSASFHLDNSQGTQQTIRSAMLWTFQRSTIPILRSPR